MEVNPGVLTTVTTAFTGLGVGIGWLLKHTRARHKDSVKEYQEITLGLQRTAENQQQKLDRLWSHMDDQQKVINRVVFLHSDCRAENAELYALLQSQNNTMKRWYTMLRDANIAVEQVPDLPPRPQRVSLDEAEFLRRSTQQGADLLSKPPRPP